jgi:glycyl-tRNA synthetase
MRFAPILAPYKAAVLPLAKKPELTSVAMELFTSLQDDTGFMVDYDETGNIGKRYRRQDEIGTPFCVTVDFDTLEDNAVTVRDRDSMEQQRLPLTDVADYIRTQVRQSAMV